jgi:hypothetical protein
MRCPGSSLWVPRTLSQCPEHRFRTTRPRQQPEPNGRHNLWRRRAFPARPEEQHSANLAVEQPDLTLAHSTLGARHDSGPGYRADRARHGCLAGIGRAITFEVAAMGYGLTVGSRDGNDLARLAPQLQAAGASREVTVVCDLAD